MIKDDFIKIIDNMLHLPLLELSNLQRDALHSMLEHIKACSKYKIITICGSTKFKDEINKEAERLTLEGNIVLNLNVFHHSDNKITDDQMELLIDMHKQKIHMCDEIFVVNVDGYIGDHTKMEIEYAEKLGKPVKYLIPLIYDNGRRKTCLL